MRALAVLLVLAARVSAAPMIGTKHPIWVQDYARDASWLISCEARKDTDRIRGTAIEYSLHGMSGDRATPWLIWGSGTGTPIDAFANQSPNGRWFAIVRGKALELFDATSRKSAVLRGASLEDDDASVPGSRLTAFGNDRMVYFRTSHDRDLVVVRELASGAERVVDIPGVVWRASVEPGDRWAKILVVRTDTNSDGKLSWPGQGRSFGLFGCFQGDPHAFAFRTSDGDEPQTLWLDLASGNVVDDPTIITSLGDGLLRRAADGSLTIDNALVAPAACKAKILALAPSPQRVVVACERRFRDRGTVAVYGPKLAVPTKHLVDYKDPLEVSVATDSHLCPHYADYCIDLATGALTALPGTSPDVWAVSGNRALILDGGQTYVWDAVASTRRVFKKSDFPDTRDGSTVAIDNELFDWVRDKRIGSADEHIYAVDATGRVLVGDPPAQPNTIASGPLHWEAR